MKSNLANLARPKRLKDFICDKYQRYLFEEIIQNNDLRSFIFYGTPGVGKTTIAYILAEELGVSYGYFNAATSDKKELVYLLDTCTILIIDEVHRLNKDKQDILLPFLENDKITVYATTTENPYHKLNPALRSRCSIINLQKPDSETIAKRLKEISLENNYNIHDDKIFDFIAKQASGDFRSSINNLELVGILSTKKEIELSELKKIMPSVQFMSDQNGDAHYDYLSAFHKSLRGSDVDAALYWGFLIIKSGDFDGLFRRMICAAYEDVGMAKPSLPVEVHTAILSFERLGMPEGYLPIANAIINICLSPKSNSAYLAAQKVMSTLDQGGIYEVPKHLKDAHYKSAAKLGNGIGYLYPHNYKNHYIKQRYLPFALGEETFYEPQNLGYEKKINEYLEQLKKE
ncbi:replication-associated recombination protein A [[Mycoplasma] falconis]|uniref:Replication-associated recombination protein A n=1 Tax=[Mycoplasma] falconis TaxID=92403 RepID=A0A501X977_9BACT|nr:replication-associated recombination protein A [[Mycoplasma] falconis]TPE57080.1 replication-associated recombination protein A [[Mycoplasma] falconis]